MKSNGVFIKYIRSVSKAEDYLLLSKAAVSATRARLNRKIALAMSNVRPPVIATGIIMPTYMALRGLSNGYADV